MKRIFFYFFFLVSMYAHAQVNLDSLWKIWNDPSAPDTLRMDVMGTISFDGYIYSDPDSAHYFAQKQLELAREKGNKKFEAQALSTQGNCFYFKGNYRKAISLQLQSLKISEEIGDLHGQASSYNNIGSVYVDQDQPDKGIDYFTRSLLIRQAIGDKEGVAASYNNIGAIYAELKKYPLANEYYQRSLKLREELNDKSGIATSYDNIGRLYGYEGKNEEARVYYDRSLKMREKIGDRRGQAMCLYNIGNIYSDQGDLKTAIDYTLRSLKVATDAHLVMQMEYGSEELYKCYQLEGMYKEALEMHKLFITMRDSTRNVESQKAILKQEMEYNYDKQKALNEKEHEKELAVSAEREKKQSLISWFVSGSLLLVLIFAFFVFSRLKLTQKQKNIIENQKHIVEEKQKEIVDSITYAKRLQDAILPSMQFLKKLLPESFVLYKPKDIVAGDFYWVEEKGDCIYLAAADCTGHGVPGAMVSVVCSTALNRSLLEFGITEPGKLLEQTRALVLETFAKSDRDVNDGMDISLCCINKTTGQLSWAGANNALWYVSGNEMKVIRADKQPIGRTANPQPFHTHFIELKKGDYIYLFTDGFADQFGGSKGKKFKYKPLMDLLLSNATCDPETQKKILEDTFISWKGTLEQVDDVCIIGVRL